MQQALNQVTQFLQQGIASIFRFIQLVWSWSLGEITKIMQVPFTSWPLWKQILILLVVAGVAWALFNAAKELWNAAERALSAFVALLAAFVRTLPHVVLAGLIALGGLWAANNITANFEIPAALKQLVSRH